MPLVYIAWLVQLEWRTPIGGFAQLATSGANGAAAQVGLRTGGTRCRGAGVLVTLADQASSFQASP